MTYGHLWADCLYIGISSGPGPTLGIEYRNESLYLTSLISKTVDLSNNDYIIRATYKHSY